MANNVFVLISDTIIPITIFYIIGSGLLQKKSIFQFFLDGALQGIKLSAKVLPSLIGLMVSVGILRASGLLEWMGAMLGKRMDAAYQEIITLVLVKLCSASAANSIAFDIFKEYGTDSEPGIMAALICCTTETVFYIMSFYYLSVKVTKIRWTINGALLVTAVGVLMSVLVAKGWFY